MINSFQDVAGNNSPGIIKVIGIGQTMRGDDAAGLDAVRLWHETYQCKLDRPAVQMHLAELPGLGLLDLLEGSRIAILVDAVCSDATPGAIHVLDEGQLEAFRASSPSAHGWGVAETLALGRKLGVLTMPEAIVLVGIEVSQLAVGTHLSETLESALTRVAQIIEQQVCLHLCA
jgi:hydrogenase maturation protease